MPFHDLNITYTSDHDTLSSTLSFAQQLGYDTAALSIIIADKLPSQLPSIPLSSLRQPDKLRLLTRLTLTVSDTTQNHRLSSLVSHYDLIALRPANEKSLQLCCGSLECDLISIDFSQRLAYPLKFKTASSALQRGIRFEICYSPGIVAGADARRNLVSGATQLIRATRGRGIIISSEAKTVLGLRAAWDAINLAQVWGLSQQHGKEALCEEAGKVVRLARLKRTSYRGVVDIINGGAEDIEDNGMTTDLPVSRAPRVGQLTQSSKVETATSPGVKRKASESSLAASKPAEITEEEQPVSKREMKRRAKKAKMAGPNAVDSPSAEKSSEFSLQHESIVSNKAK